MGGVILFHCSSRSAHGYQPVFSSFAAGLSPSRDQRCCVSRCPNCCKSIVVAWRGSGAGSAEYPATHPAGSDQSMESGTVASKPCASCSSPVALGALPGATSVRHPVVTNGQANVPVRDTMGKITAHRAWTTIASALYNAPEGLNTGELGQWLGHKDIRSTQYCAKLHPARLANRLPGQTRIRGSFKFW